MLHASGFTPRRFAPAEQEELLAYGLGITNVVARATARADELTAEEFGRAGGCSPRRWTGCGRGGWRSRA